MAARLQVIKGRRESGVKEDDMLQTLIDSRYRNVYGGRATNDDEIAGLLIAILFAGQHTSSVTSSWTGYRMLSTRKWFEVGAPPCRGACAQVAVSRNCFRGWPCWRLSCACGPQRCPSGTSRVFHPRISTSVSVCTPSSVRQAAQEEQRAVMRQHGDTLDMDVLNSMHVLHRNIQEALRMEPPLVGPSCRALCAMCRLFYGDVSFVG